MRKSIVAVLYLVLVAVTAASSVQAFTLNKPVDVELKGELTYALRVRTEYPDEKLMFGLKATGSGDRNFDKWDLANNKTITRWELTARAAPHFTFFGRLEMYGDPVYHDDRFNWETRKHAEYNFFDSAEYYLEATFGSFTGRIGRQIVQWGDSVAPIFAVGVNTISPFFGANVQAAGYTIRDYHVPSYMAWGKYEYSETVTFEGVWAPDFDPRYSMPAVGTFASFTDALGFGQDGSVDDRRPDGFSNQQQFGGAMRLVIPSLKNLELGFYYFHHLSRSPVVSALSLSHIVADYPKIDMIGASFMHTIDALQLQVNGELAFRPNDVLQKNLIASSPFLASAFGVNVGEVAGSLGGYKEGKTLNWVFDCSRIFSDVLPFTHHVFSFVPLVEFYGGINLSYDEAEHFTTPESTYYYMADLALTTADLIPNTTVTLDLVGTGNLHETQRSLQHLIPTLKARYGNSLEALVGYDLILGRPEENNGPNNMPDRDAFTFKLTWYFI